MTKNTKETSEMDSSMFQNLGSAFAELWSGIEVNGSFRETFEKPKIPDFVELLNFNDQLQSTMCDEHHQAIPIKHWASL